MSVEEALSLYYAHFVVADMKLLCSIKYLVFSNVLLFVLFTLSTAQLLESLWCRLTRLDDYHTMG